MLAASDVVASVSFWDFGASAPGPGVTHSANTLNGACTGSGAVPSTRVTLISTPQVPT